MTGTLDWTYGAGYTVHFLVRFDWNAEDNWLDIEAMEVQGVDVMGVLADDVLDACETAIKRRLRAGYRGDDDA